MSVTYMASVKYFVPLYRVHSVTTVKYSDVDIKCNMLQSDSEVYILAYKSVGATTNTSEITMKYIFVNMQKHIEFGIALYIKRFTIEGRQFLPIIRRKWR
jgi:hypothetical protein